MSHPDADIFNAHSALNDLTDLLREIKLGPRVFAPDEEANLADDILKLHLDAIRRVLENHHRNRLLYRPSTPLLVIQPEGSDDQG